MMFLNILCLPVLMRFQNSKYLRIGHPPVHTNHRLADFMIYNFPILVKPHKVLVELTSYGEKGKNPEGKVKEIIGHVNDPGTDILSV